MRITERRLRRIVRQEIVRINEAGNVIPYSGEASAQGLSAPQQIAYAAARGLGGATPLGAQSVARQDSSFYTGILKDTWKNNKMDMLDWGLTAASLTASISQVGKPISIALDSASAVKNLTAFGASGFRDVGSAIGSVLDLCGIASAGISDAARGIWLYVKKGAEIPEGLLKKFSSVLIGILGTKLSSLLAWMRNPASAQWAAESFAQFAKMNADEGAEAVLQKFVNDFFKEKAVGAAVEPNTISSLANQGLQAVKDAASKALGSQFVSTVQKAIEIGARELAKFFNSIISDGLRLMFKDLLKVAASTA